jgi:hypothetical protein
VRYWRENPRRSGSGRRRNTAPISEARNSSRAYYRGYDLLLGVNAEVTHEPGLPTWFAGLGCSRFVDGTHRFGNLTHRRWATTGRIIRPLLLSSKRRFPSFPPGLRRLSADSEVLAFRSTELRQRSSAEGSGSPDTVRLNADVPRPTNRENIRAGLSLPIPADAALLSPPYPHPQNAKRSGVRTRREASRQRRERRGSGGLKLRDSRSRRIRGALGRSGVRLFGTLNEAGRPTNHTNVSDSRRHTLAAPRTGTRSPGVPIPIGREHKRFEVPSPTNRRYG